MLSYEPVHRGENGKFDEGMPDRSGIYVIRHVPSGKIYVGSALNIRKRLREHRRCLRLGEHKNGFLQSDFVKTGPESFRAEILEFLPAENKTLLTAEDLWIERLNSRKRCSGYNIHSALYSRRGVKAKPETCARIGLAKSGNQNRKGASLTQETREKIAARLRGRTTSAESKRNQSVARKGKKKSAAWCKKMSDIMKGRTISQEQRDRISATLKGRQRSPEEIEKSRFGMLRLYASGYKKPPLSESARAKISAKGKGRVLSAETRAKMSAARKGKTMSGDQKAAVAERMRQIWKARKNALCPSSDQS